MKSDHRVKFGSRLRRSVLAVGVAVGAIGASGASASTLYFDFNKNAVGGAANASVFLFGAAGQNATITVPARIVWTRFCNSGRLSHGMSLTGFEG